ncbi:Teichoic acid biosynthesis protein C (Precursor) [Streptomyces aquilus]|uniref:phage baseplate protein n=1 Tax=Streptomyces aquilus TaxID=2548456 RepID=UPI001FCA7A24|nr:Teichoic acid biosynthesis protein C (Precursor) [Streptomyces aquilus]
MTDRVDLDVPAKRRLKEKALHEGTVLQSFAFDEVHQHLYVLQVRRGGIGAGNLCLNKLEYDGTLLGHMHLQGFGHGVSMGVQNAADGKVWIWTESEAKRGYGQSVTRFQFAAGATRTVADVNTRKPIPGSTNNQPTVCMASKRIAVRYRIKGKPRYRVWDLDAFVHRAYDDPITDIAQPAPHPDPKIPFQGYALHGDHLYQLAGTAYDPKTNPAAKFGNAHLSCVDLTTGELLQRMRTQAGRSLTHREPEGLAVRHRTGKGLYLGLASGAAGARRFSLYAKPLA